MQRLEERRRKVLGKEIAAFDSDARPSLNPMAAPFVPGLAAGTRSAPFCHFNLKSPRSSPVFDYALGFRLFE
jgi:hypothetical protein